MTLNHINPVTQANYHRIVEIIQQQGIKFIGVQYPVRIIDSLKKMLNPFKDIIFVDNERIFKDAVKQDGYEDYFSDSFGGNFGHCTPKGNRLLAENVANAILNQL